MVAAMISSGELALWTRLGPEMAAFAMARLDEEEPSGRCGCLDADHQPPCTPQPWADRKRRSIAAHRAVVAEYAARVRGVSEGLSVPQRRLAQAVAAIWEDHAEYDPKWRP